MSRSRVGSLGRRLSHWLALQSLAGLVVICAAVYAATQLGLQDRQTEALAQKRAQLQHLLIEAARDGDTGALKHKLDDFFIGHEDLSLRLEMPDGAVFYRSPTAPPAGGEARRLQFELPSPMSATEVLIATLTLDVGDDTALLRRIGLTLLAAALAGALVISVGGFVLVRLGLRPLRQLVDQTRRLAADTLHRRLDGSSQPEELEPMITQFNELLGRLEQAYERVEGFNADVAHELCTPLATLIGSTELALRKSRSADELREVLASNLEELQRVAGNRAGHAVPVAGRSWCDGPARTDEQPGRCRPKGRGLPRGGDGRCADRSGSMRGCRRSLRHFAVAAGFVQPDRERDALCPTRDRRSGGDRRRPGGRSDTSGGEPWRHDSARTSAEAV